MTGSNISKSLIDSNSHINVKGLMRYSGYVENNAFMIPILYRIRRIQWLVSLNTLRYKHTSVS